MSKESLPHKNNRILSLKKWIDDNEVLFSQSDRMRIVLNIKGSSIVLEVTTFPEPLRSQEKGVE